ncbi:MAG: hypothetical protein LBD75_03720, partial [Candidatus Peribacteria bacterium]|nr:hypothetical protein [Candidatus Peribacteria bacterium]
MKNNTLFQQFKQWGLNVSVSSIIFVSVVLLGGTIITLALPSSLDEVKSSNANHQLTAENWDYLVEQVSGQISKLATLSGRVSTLLDSSTWKKNGNNIYYNNGNIGIGTTPSSSYKTYIYNSSSNRGLYINNQTGTYGLYVGGTGRNYFAGNVGIGTTPSSSYR